MERHLIILWVRNLYQILPPMKKEGFRIRQQLIDSSKWKQRPLVFKDMFPRNKNKLSEVEWNDEISSSDVRYVHITTTAENTLGDLFQCSSTAPSGPTQSQWRTN